MEILPDSRAKVTKGAVYEGAREWVPVFCGSCGKEGGLVTSTCTFAFWVCRVCEKKHGEILGLARVPDAVFYERLAQEQIEAYGRYLNHNELLQIVAEDSTPLATLMKEAK